MLIRQANQSLGGQHLKQKQVEIGKVQLLEFGYSWTDLRSLIKVILSA